MPHFYCMHCSAVVLDSHAGLWEFSPAHLCSAQMLLLPGLCEHTRTLLMGHGGLAVVNVFSLCCFFCFTSNVGTPPAGCGSKTASVLTGSTSPLDTGQLPSATYTFTFTHTCTHTLTARKETLTFFSVTLKYHCRQEGLPFLIVACQNSARSSSLWAERKKKTILDELFFYFLFVFSCGTKCHFDFRQNGS